MGESKTTYENFVAYYKTHAIIYMIKDGMDQIPSELREAVTTYVAALEACAKECGSDIYSLGSNDHAYAIGAVRAKYHKLPAKGNCRRCGGTGYIKAFSHRAQGVCLKCKGTGGSK